MCIYVALASRCTVEPYSALLVMKVHGALLGVTRHRLAMSRKGLAFLTGSVETACNVPAARKTWAASARK